MRNGSTAIQPLVAGERLTWKEFERRWDATPGLRRAELIGGVVYMAPLEMEHGDRDQMIGALIVNYRLGTPGCGSGAGATWHMVGDAPQPDEHLRILDNHGGQSRIKGKYGYGAPELIIEVADSTVKNDLRQKKSLYYRAGVKEYIAVLLKRKEIRWFVWTDKGYQLLAADKKGVFRSNVFPGFWLNATALFARDDAELMSTLNAGLSSREHAAFVRKLAAVAKNLDKNC